jgi:hypothetical protein
MAFAVVQIVVHMVCFLHMNGRSEGGWTLMALIFTIVIVLIVLAGSLWVMYHLNSNMMPDMTRTAGTMPALSGANGALCRSPRVALLPARASPALGVWQIERRAWKLDLIARVDARIHAPPAALPGPRMAGAINAAAMMSIAVSRTAISMRRETLDQAVTERGPGFWVLTPFAADLGFTVLVNRGFVPEERRGTRRAAVQGGGTTVTGLLRLSEPGGGFLRANDPAAALVFARRRGDRPRAGAGRRSRPISSMPTPPRIRAAAAGRADPGQLSATPSGLCADLVRLAALSAWRAAMLILRKARRN